jgi:outer membrane protein OmpA-like peptidoglycan-associated protein
LSVLFENDSAELCPYSKGSLMGIAKMFMWSYNEATLSVSGHTNNIASAEYNMGLSKRRAQSVKQALVEGGIPADRLDVSHHGLTKPVADNTTAEGLAKNRRVELLLDSPDVDSPYCYPKRK